MAVELPITNIPLIFTQYRTRILEESGRQWFHLDNGHEPEAIAVDADAPLSSENGPNTSAPSGREYNHPDPWDMPQLETPTDPAFERPPSEKLAAPTPASMVSEPQLTSPPDLSAMADLRGVDSAASDQQNESQSETVVQQNVNLFPIDELPKVTPPSEGLYDLTEFDNGEIEVPPVAVRSTQLSNFEKVSPAQPPNPNPQTPDGVAPPEGGSAKPKRPKLSSAEIAKYRLRNCL